MKSSSLLLLCTVGLGLTPSYASEPGQPLDCSDWVISEPGISCREIRECGVEATTGNVDFPCYNLSGSGIDTEGAVLGLERVEPADLLCGGNRLGRLDFRSFGNNVDRSLGSVSERCVNPARSCLDKIAMQNRAFDPSNGRLYVWFRSYQDNSGSCGDGWPPFYDRQWLAVFEGFTTTFEILQTYTPSASLGFRVPYMPEGLPAADHFDTYYGPLVKPIDFSQAQGLQCDYPATPPVIGDYLEVADSVPMPAPGRGYYYVTAVTHLGQTRYGRKASGGVLSGRDPALLSACTLQDEGE
jgi:hypothetical protein